MRRAGESAVLGRGGRLFIASMVAAFCLLAAWGGNDLGAQVGGARANVAPMNWENEFQKVVDEFKDWRNWAAMLGVLLLAVLLAMAIAYHPRTYGKAATLEEADQPRIFIMYAVVGAVIAEVVKVHEIMGLVVFGIGGLLRFRTDVGPAKDTGRVILVTAIGLCCGLLLIVPAIIATAFAWVLIWFIEASVAHRMLVKGLDPTILAKSAEAYEEVLRENGLHLLSQKKNFVKNQVAFVFRAPGKLDREQLEFLFKDIPPKLQGAVDWESS